MNADRYTKAVLTVIAAALVFIAGENLIRPAFAATGDVQKVMICSLDSGGGVPHCAAVNNQRLLVTQ
jgi:hypothetical protein